LNVSVSKNGKDWQDVYTLEDEKKAGENDIKLPSSMRTFLKRKDDPNKEILHTRHRALQLLLARVKLS